jgi:hypothetical protein
MFFPTLILSFAVASATPPGVVIDPQPAATRQYIGSPSIAILPNGDFVSSHDFFGPGSTQSTSAVTRVFRSQDKGRTWRQTAELHDQFWSTLFVHRGNLYLMGTTYEYGRIVIRRSADGGRQWSGPAFLTEGTGFHTAPVPVVEANGRLWRAFEYHPTGPWGSFEAFLMSAPLNADIMKAASWTMTERLPFPKATHPEGQTWLEGNAVVARDGCGTAHGRCVVDILRVHDTENAATLQVAGGHLRFQGLSAFPGGAKKFTIRFDRKTQRYFALANPALPEYPLSATNPASVRNTLALLSSRDLREWKQERIVLSHPDVTKHGFQYVDWQFDGPDLAAVIRAGFDDDEGGAPRAHDANFLLFYRVKNFRKSGSTE